MLDEQASEILRLKSELIKVKAENAKLTPSLKETQENLIALENNTRRENLRFMNIPESKNENCTDIVYDIIENDLNIDPEEIRFHAVHRVGKPHTQDDATTPRPRPIIARFVVREDRDSFLGQKPTKVLIQILGCLYHSRLCSRNSTREENLNTSYVRCKEKRPRCKGNQQKALY